jgi:ribose 5-phosphate isomerase A
MEAKKLAGEKAAEFIENGMKIGLGTGSTVYWTILRVGQLVKEGLQIEAIPTSKQTEALAKEHGIPLTDFSKVTQLDLTIDGADEIDEHFNLIKGGGGALLREKLVAAASKHFIVVADESKLVKTLGQFPLPVEVTPFAWEVTAQRIVSLNGNPVLRKKENQTFITDNGNYILDCHFKQISNPADLHNKLKLITGIVETGLFTNLTDMVVAGTENGARLME